MCQAISYKLLQDALVEAPSLSKEGIEHIITRFITRPAESELKQLAEGIRKHSRISAFR